MVPIIPPIQQLLGFAAKEEKGIVLANPAIRPPDLT
jgi:hypothetical protein